MVGQSSGIPWEASLEQARERAWKEGKPLLIDFRSAPDSSASVWLDTVTYADRRVASFISQHFVPIRVVVDAKTGVAARRAVPHGPAVIVGGGGREAHYRVDPHLSPEEFSDQLRLGLGRYRFDQHEFAEAIRYFQKVLNCHATSETAFQALFWLGLAQYMQSSRAECAARPCAAVRAKE